jgi:sigma-E factor negative regulatory protein RseC
MAEVAKVISVNSNMAKVQIMGPEGCGSGCGSCKGCSAAASTLVEVKNIVDAKVGQEVKIERNVNLYIKSAALVFGLPMIMLFIGMMIGSGMTDILNTNMSKDLLGAIIGIGFWIVSYLIIRLVDKKYKLSSKINYTIVDVV